MTTDISIQAITFISLNKDYVRISPLIIDATTLCYDAMFTDGAGNNSLNSIFTNTQANINGTRILKKNFKLHHISSRRNSRNKANNNARKHFPDSSHTKSSKKQKYRIHANNQPYNPQ